MSRISTRTSTRISTRSSAPTSLNGGLRRTPTIDLGLGGAALVEPDNDTLTGALVEMQMFTYEQVRERLDVQNVGDVERLGRTIGGLAILALGSTAPQSMQWPVRMLGAGIALTGVAGWCPLYHSTGVTSARRAGRPAGRSHAPALAHARSAAIRDDAGSGTMTSTLDGAFDALVAGRHGDPFALLGPHLEHGHLVIRALLPDRRAGAGHARRRRTARDGQARTPAASSKPRCLASIA